MTTITLSPFALSEYFRDHAPATARAGMRGYILRLLVDMVRLRGANAGTCWPSIAYLSEKVGRSARHVQRLLRELETLGEIERIIQRRSDGGQSSNLYRLRGLISWAAKNVTPPHDKRVTQTPYGKKSNPARGGKPVSRKAQAAPSCPALPSVKVEATGHAKTSSGAFSIAPVRSAPKWRALSSAQVQEARNSCDPMEWERLRLAAGLDGVASVDLDAAAAHRWRAEAIMRGVNLVA